MTSRIISKNRVEHHGEVFTGQREINAMVDLVQEQAERIESRFLEPACGDGNFLVEVLERKLATLSKTAIQKEWEYDALTALASLYGIDILEDNVQKCRQRLEKIFFQKYPKRFSKENTLEQNEKLQKSVKFILEKNIVHGDALNYQRISGGNIYFSEWTQIEPFKIQRKESAFSNLSLPLLKTEMEEQIWQAVRYNEIYKAPKLLQSSLIK